MSLRLHPFGSFNRLNYPVAVARLVPLRGSTVHTEVPTTAAAVRPPNPKDLSRKIRNSKQAFTVIRLLQDHADTVNGIHLAAAVNQLAKFHQSSSNRQERQQQQQAKHFLLQVLESWEPHDLSQLGPREFATVLWGLGVLRVSPKPHAWALIFNRLHQLAPELNPQGSTLTLWALQALAAPLPPPLLFHLLYSQAPKWPSYPPKSLAMFLQSLAKLHPKPHLHPHQLLPPLFHPAIFSATSKQLYSASPRDVAFMLWSLATLKVPLPGRLGGRSFHIACNNTVWGTGLMANLLWHVGVVIIGLGHSLAGRVD